MKTIEDCEFEISSLAAVVSTKLDLFEENISYLTSVINKDPKIVYDKLVEQFNSTMELFNTRTSRNVEILEGYISTLDKILDVLREVEESINVAKNSPDASSIDVKNATTAVLENAVDKANEIADDASIALEKAAGITNLDHAWIKMALLGGGAYMGLRFLGAGRFLSLVGAAGFVWWNSKQA